MTDHEQPGTPPAKKSDSIFKELFEEYGLTSEEQLLVLMSVSHLFLGSPIGLKGVDVKATITEAITEVLKRRSPSA